MSTPPETLIGQTLDGYLIEKLLGQGGMARVYRGYDARLHRYVAIKVITPSARQDAEYATRFEREARAIAQLWHPNIVSIYRFGEVGGLYFMAMQYVEGVDLAWVLNDYAQSHELMPHEDVLRMIQQVGAALDYAHSKGVIHRDVKPSNILLDMEGRAVLTDFGLALVESEGTQGEIFGTPHYISPEQTISSASAVPGSDLYSLGVTLYEMLTGTVPFTGKSTMSIAMAHMTDPLPSPLERNPDLHPAFVPVLEKALQKDVKDRYLSGVALGDALEKAIEESKRDPSKTSRISLLSVPRQVELFSQANPLPPLPAAVADEPPPAPAQPAPPAVKVPPVPQTVFRPQPPQPIQTAETTRLRPSNQGQVWRWIAVASAAMIVVGVLAVASLLFRQNSGASATEVNTPTVTPLAAAAQPTAAPTETPRPAVSLPIETPLPPPPTLMPTTPPTETAVMVEPTLVTIATTAVPLNVPPTPIPVVTSVTNQQANAYWILSFLADGNNRFYVINVSGASLPPFPINDLQLTADNGNVVVTGNLWSIPNLPSGACVALIRRERDMRNIDNCTLVSAIQVDGAYQFWRGGREAFTISYPSLGSLECTNEAANGAGCRVSIAS